MCHIKDIYYYGKLTPVMADPEWTQPVGLRDDKLFTTPFENTLPYPNLDYDLLAVLNGEWISSSVFHESLVAIMTTLNTLNNQIISATNKINDMKEVLL